MSALQLADVVLGDRRQYGRLLLRELRDALASCQRTITAHVSATCSYAAAPHCHPRVTCALSPVGSMEREHPWCPRSCFQYTLAEHEVSRHVSGHVVKWVRGGRSYVRSGDGERHGAWTGSRQDFLVLGASERRINRS